MWISLHRKLCELEKHGFLQLQSTWGRHFLQGEGSLTYNGKRIECLYSYMGPSPDGNGYFNRPHDVAWCPEENIVLAVADSIFSRDKDRFKPLLEKLVVKNLLIKR